MKYQSHGGSSSNSKEKQTDLHSQPLLEVTDLHVQFPTRRGIVRAVNGVSLTVNQGEIVGIVGESGSGKSMTVRAVMRLIPDSGDITRGSVRLKGRELLTINRHEIAKVRGRHIAMIFQEPGAALNPVLTVGEQIVEVLNVHHGLKGKAARERAIEHLREVGIPAPVERFRAFPHELSGGMQQRCVIAIALACDPQVLIADEPTTSLDVTIQAQILKLLTKLAKEKNVGLIFITHNIAAVAQIAQRILVMYAGSVVESGRTEQIIDHPQHPYTQALLRAMPTMKSIHEDRLEEIRGRVPDLARIPSGCPFHPRCPHAWETCEQDIPVLQQTEPDRTVSCWLYSEKFEETSHANHGHKIISD